MIKNQIGLISKITYVYPSTVFGGGFVYTNQADGLSNISKFEAKFILA
jgi:hypothetical protein